MRAELLLVKGLIWLFQVYKLVLSPLLGPACRYYPTCSSYAVAAVSTHGASRGLLLTLLRLIRCHPFSPGGYDPVAPEGEPGRRALFSGAGGLGSG